MTRAQIEAAVELLIDHLDALDGDPDLEREETDVSAREWCGAGAHRFDTGAEA